MISNLHHVAILTSNMDDSIEFYMELFNCEKPRVVDVEKQGMKFRSAMLPIGKEGKTYLQILEPSEGPGVEELSKGGEGTIFEIGYQVEDIEQFYERMSEKGIKPVDFAGVEIDGKYIKSSFGNKYYFLPKVKTRGTRTEVVEVQ